MRKEITKVHEMRAKRAMRVRQKLRGTSVRPRLCVVKSNKHIQAQLIDDENGVTLGYVCTSHPEFRGGEFGKKSKVSAAKIGEKIAGIAKQKDIKEVIFDRGAAKYHGVLAALADSARASGLQF